MDTLISLLLGFVALLGGVFWIWMLIDCATKESNQGNTKVVWILIIALGSCIGAALYYFVRRPKRYWESVNQSMRARSAGRT